MGSFVRGIRKSTPKNFLKFAYGLKTYFYVKKSLKFKFWPLYKFQKVSKIFFWIRRINSPLEMMFLEKNFCLWPLFRVQKSIFWLKNDDFRRNSHICKFQKISKIFFLDSSPQTTPRMMFLEKIFCLWPLVRVQKSIFWLKNDDFRRNSQICKFQKI